MDPAKPSLSLLRELSDEHVLRALLAERRLTRAELAQRTGISKPTAGESVRRLVARGVVVDTGERTTGPGRIGSYYALAPDVGCALVVDIAPAGITGEVVDVWGTTVAAATEPLPRPAPSGRVTDTLASLCGSLAARTTAPVRLAVVSAADPVDRVTGRVVGLPDAPFLLGELAPVEALESVVRAPVWVDNDINWAARAERAATDADWRDDFVYVYLDEGLGCAVVSDGDVRRGHHGLAGEISHILTTGPDGAILALIDVFAALHLRHEGSTAIDVAALAAAVDPVTSPEAARVVADLATAVSGVLRAVVALADPAAVVVGGRWGGNPRVLDALRRANDRSPRPAPLRPATVAGAPLAGARALAVTELRAAVTRRGLERG